MICFFVVLWAAVVAGRPNVAPLNVVTVPPNCPGGQQWINGQCRDIWYIHAEPKSDLNNLNVITVPPNCPPGQEWMNGACRDVWRLYENAESLPTWNEADRDVWRRPKSDPNNLNVITVPSNCPPGQEWINGACRDVWRFYENAESLPTWNEADRDVWRSLLRDIAKGQVADTGRKIINIPDLKCPIGYIKDALGNCREIF